MSKEQAKYKERVYWISEKHDDGRVAYTGKSVNYGGICSSWISVDDLYKNMQSMIDVWIKYAQETMDQHDPLEMVECKTQEEWDGTDDNIDYWEIERMKRILKRTSMGLKIAEVLMNELRKSTTRSEYPEDTAVRLLDALINQPNE